MTATFACPRCDCVMPADADRGASCETCGIEFELRGGIWRCLSDERLAEVEPFLNQYRIVRERDGYRGFSGAACRALPHVEDEDPQASSWRVRQSSYRTFRHEVLGAPGRVLTVLDLGAGNGWLSYRLTRLGHRAVAVDWLDDEADGLGAWTQYDLPFMCVQADFDSLPFAGGQFDLVVFNGSLHYAPDPAATLAAAAKLLAPSGTLVVMDSPMFHRADDGRDMIRRQDAIFRADYGVVEVVRRGVGYLTLASLAEAVGPLGLEPRFLSSSGGAVWAARRFVARIRLRRQPAGFGVWVAR
jgi:SAM-dependent methyltransferase